MARLRFPQWDPFRELLELQNDLDRVFESPYGFDLGMSGRGVFPPVNVFTDREGCVLKIEVPGVAPQDLKIENHGRTLTIRGKREWKAPEEGKGSFHRRERNQGEFSRSLQLPADLDSARAEATCKHGILTIRVPKKEQAKPRQIEIRAA